MQHGRHARGSRVEVTRAGVRATDPYVASTGRDVEVIDRGRRPPAQVRHQSPERAQDKAPESRGVRRSPGGAPHLHRGPRTGRTERHAPDGRAAGRAAPCLRIRSPGGRLSLGRAAEPRASLRLRGDPCRPSTDQPHFFAFTFSLTFAFGFGFDLVAPAAAALTSAARTDAAPPPITGPVRGSGASEPITLAPSGAALPVTAQWSSLAWLSTNEAVRIPQNSNP